jgi:hypothetical protein
MAARGWAAAVIPRSAAGSWESVVGPCLPCPPAFPRVAVPSVGSAVRSACSVVRSVGSAVRSACSVVRLASAAAEWASAAWTVAPAVTSRACRRQRHRHHRPGPSTGVHGPRPPPERRRWHTRHNPHADLQHADAWTVTFSRAFEKGIDAPGTSRESGTSQAFPRHFAAAAAGVAAGAGGLRAITSLKSGS